MIDIPRELLEQIAKRANDPLRRTYGAGVRASAQPLDISSLLWNLQKHGAAGAQGLAGALGNLQSLMGGLGGAMLMGPSGATSIGAPAAPGAEPLRPAPDPARLAQAEAALGRPFPAALRQLYTIGDGGFGPGDGLFPLAAAIDRYRDMVRKPFGPNGQNWPPKLLPLFDENPVLVCVDLETGAIVAWDPEEIENEDSEADWQRSFKPEQPDLAELMRGWIASPAFGDQDGGPTGA